MPEQFLFFKGIPGDAPAPSPLPEGYEARYWRPSLRSLLPPGCGAYPFLVWRLMHMLRFFHNRDYGVYVIRHRGRWVHRSVITPRFFRFPFMDGSDLQVGDVWTDEEERGKGLAKTALLSILHAEPDRQRTYWYLVENSNRPSIRVAEGAHLRRVAVGVRANRWGLRFFGAYRPQDPVTG